MGPEPFLYTPVAQLSLRTEGQKMWVLGGPRDNISAGHRPSGPLMQLPPGSMPAPRVPVGPMGPFPLWEQSLGRSRCGIENVKYRNDCVFAHLALQTPDVFLAEGCSR